MNRLLKSLFLGLIISGSAHARDAGSDGTIPLKLSGQAYLNGAQDQTIQTSIKLNAKPKEADRTTARNCPLRGQSINHYKARGTVKVGNLNYVITSVCKNRANSMLSIQAKSGNKLVKVKGKLNQSPEEASLMGNLKLQTNRQVKNYRIKAFGEGSL